MYATLIEAFDSEKLQIRLYYLVGYGVPLTVVIVACYMDPHMYNTNNSFCLQANTIILYTIMFVVSVSHQFKILLITLIDNSSKNICFFCTGKSSLSMFVIVHY